MNGRHQDVLRILEQPLNWDYVFHAAGRNGLLPLISWNLLRKFSDLLPIEINERLSAFLQAHTRKNLFLTLKLIEIVELLKENGIPVLPIKGTVLAHQAYNDLSLRQYVDLDVLVRPKDFDDAAMLLRDKGYTQVGDATGIKRKYLFFTRKKDIGLVSPDGQVRLELHWKLSGSHFAMPLEINQLWSRLETINLGGANLKALPFRDLFVYLCLHGSRHGWEKFSWICDLNELVRATERTGVKIDWEEVQQHAKKHGCEKVVELGLFLVNEFFELRLNYPGIDRILHDRNFEVIAEGLRAKLFATKGSTSQIGEWYLYHLALKERRTDKLRVHLVYLTWYLKLAFMPNELDEAVFRLPALFHPLYYILRPIRLVFTYAKLSPKKPR